MCRQTDSEADGTENPHRLHQPRAERRTDTRLLNIGDNPPSPGIRIQDSGVHQFLVALERKREESLFSADYVSVKVDTVNEATWLRINRPHSRLQFDAIRRAWWISPRSYNGILTTETMFVNTMNDTLEEVRALATYLARVKRERSYFAIPLRPPAESYAIAPPPETLSVLSRAVTSTIAGSEMLCCPEGPISTVPMTPKKLFSAFSQCIP